MGDVNAWKNAIAAVAFAAAGAEDAAGVGTLGYLPTREGPPVIHRRGRFKPNQRKQRKGQK